MKHDPFPIPEMGSDSQKEPQSPEPHPRDPLHNAFVADDALLDALERRIETPTFDSILDQDSLARQLEAAERSVTGPATAGIPNPLAGRTPEASMIQDAAVINPGLETDSRNPQNPTVSPGYSDSSTNRNQNSPGQSYPSPRDPFPHPRSRRGGRKPRPRLPKRLRTVLFRSLIPWRGRRPPRQWTGPFFNSLDTTACAERNYEFVDKQVCQDCPNYQVWPVTGRQECIYKWDLLQSIYDHESSEDSQAGDEDSVES